MLSGSAFVHIIDTVNLISLAIIDHKQGRLVPLLNKFHSYACIYSHMVSHAIAQKITIHEL